MKTRFTAEASLYSSGGIYAAMESYNQDYRQQGTIRPANARSCIKICGGDPDCLQCCLCVGRGGHPSHCCY